MSVTVSFYSYFKDLAGCRQAELSLEPGSTLGSLLEAVAQRFPKLAPLKQSALLAVGVEYQPKTYVLQAGDEVSLFPPVQGG